MTDEIRDVKLLARIRRLIRTQHAGFVADANGRQHLCLEPGCSCAETWPGSDRPMSGPFRNPPVRCTSFETSVLGLDPKDLTKESHFDSLDFELAEAYRVYLLSGQRVKTRRCSCEGCHRELTSVGPAAKYCDIHAAASIRRSKREYQRTYRKERNRVEKLPPQTPGLVRSLKASPAGEGI
jgi:hypothetical protein